MRTLFIISLLCLTLGLTLSLSACGKKGDLEPPEGAGELTYPQQYPQL